MDFQRFKKLIKQYRLLIIFGPVLAIIATHVLVEDMPNEFRSQALLSTGLTDQSQRVIVGDSQMDYFSVNQQFENIIGFLRMKKNVNLLSYKLILHDLENPQNAFTELPEDLASLDTNQRKEVISEYKALLMGERIITPEDNKVYDLFDFLKSMRYDQKTIDENLNISRKDNSDYIEIEYVSKNPYESAFVVNTIANDFVSSYQERASVNQSNSKDLLDSLLQKKEVSMNDKNAQVKEFQVRNSVINLASQADMLYSQITTKEELRGTTVGEIQALQGGIRGIEEKLKNKNSDLMSANMVDNNLIVNLKNQLQRANERYVDNGFRPEHAAEIDSLQTKLSKLIVNSSVNSTTDPKLLRQNLLQQKLTMEVDLDRAKNGLKEIIKDLARLRNEYSRMVPQDAGLKNFEREAQVATKEYLNTLDMYNQNSIVANTGVKPVLIQAGVNSPPDPSKRILYVALSGFGSFASIVFALLIAFLLDRKVRDAGQLTVLTGKPIIGQINNIVPNNTELKTVWEEEGTKKDYLLYKDLVRSLRFDIDSSLRRDGTKIVGIAGIVNNAGCSFISSSLAYSFAMTKKRVLLIGGDYKLDKDKEIKKIEKSQLFDSFIVKRELQTDKFITKLTTRNNGSLLEDYNEESLKNGFEALKEDFDIILIDVQSLEQIHTAKEWLMFTDKAVGVFPAGKSLSPYDKEMISYMNNLPGFLGWVLNKTRTEDIGPSRIAKSS